MCRVSFKQISSFLRRCCEAANPANFASGNTQYKLTQASTFPGQGASPLTRWGGWPQPANGLCPLTPAVRCRPCTPAQRAGRPLYSRKRSWLPPQKRFSPVSPVPYPHICAHRREVNTEYACGDCRSKQRVQTRHFDRNRPNFRRFFLLPSLPESHALWRRRWRRLSVPRCKAG